MPISHLPRDTSVLTVVDAIRRDGAVIVDDLVSNQLLARMAAELASAFNETEFGTDEFNGLHTRRTGALIAGPSQLVNSFSTLSSWGRRRRSSRTRRIFNCTSLRRSPSDPNRLLRPSTATMGLGLLPRSPMTLKWR